MLIVVEASPTRRYHGTADHFFVDSPRLFASNFTNSAMVSRTGGYDELHPGICADFAKLRMAFIPTALSHELSPCRLLKRQSCD